MIKNGKIMCDFDGTITNHDVTDTLLERFAHKEWLSIEKQWLDGEISAKTCMARQIAMIKAEQAELDACIDAVSVTPGFVEFAQFCREHGMPFYVVSDGIDYVINRVLSRCGLSDIPVVANRLMAAGESFRLDFPYAQEGCKAGVCKCAVAGTDIGNTILIGDSYSDICISEKVAVVFVRENLPLEHHCRQNQIDYTPFSGFYTILTSMKRLVG